MRRLFAAALAAILGLGLGGCAFGTGFKGPGYVRGVGVTLPGDGPVVMALTRASLKPGTAGRRLFWQETNRLHAELEAQPGLVGFALRRTLDGSTGWTMTVWQDEAALRTFQRSEAHRSAVRTAMEGVDSAVFARKTLPRSAIPIDWDTALAILERDGYSYQ